MHILPGQVARVKRVCLRYVSVCLRLIYVFIFINMDEHLGFFEDWNLSQTPDNLEMQL